MRILNLSQHLTNLSSLTSTLFALFHQFPPKSPSFPFLMKMNSFKTLPYNNKMRKCPLCLVVHLLQPDPPKSIDSLSKRIEMRTRPCVHWYFMYTCTPRWEHVRVYTGKMPPTARWEHVCLYISVSCTHVRLVNVQLHFAHTLMYISAICLLICTHNCMYTCTSSYLMYSSVYSQTYFHFNHSFPQTRTAFPHLLYTHQYSINS